MYESVPNVRCLFLIVYQNLGYTDNLPNAELAAKEVLSLPIHPGLSERDLKTIVEVLSGR